MRLIVRTARLRGRLAPVADAINRHPRVLIAGSVAVSLSVWLVGGWLAWFSYDLTQLPSRDAIRTMGEMVQATTLYDVHDQPVFAIFKEQRIEVPLSKVSPAVIKAVTAIEDQRFFTHSGVDFVRIGGAVLTNLRQGRRAHGGSTITQQLARQTFLTLDKTYRRKLKEAVLAAYIEREYSKEEILELYLNKIYFGDGFYGAEAAALGFFGKRASELDVADAALLAGLIQSPSTYAPTINLNRAIARRDVVLTAMLEVGSISKAEFAKAKAKKVVLTNALRREEAFGLYFKEQVRQELVERFGWERVYEGGLKVYTTIDPDMQKAAEQAVEQQLARIEGLPAYVRERARGAAARAQPASGPGEPPAGDTLQGALMAMDPKTGQVLALVGGRRFAESRFNRAVQAKRQPGSAFKPFVFAAALESGFTPASVIDGLDEALSTPQGAWMPEDEHLESPSMTLRTALRTSSNRAAVHLLADVGMKRTMDHVSRMNMGKLPSVPSVALGAGEVTLQSMTAAFAAFANRGKVPKPLVIRRVEDETGAVLYQSTVTLSPAVSESTAFQMANMLADVINAGTASRARSLGFQLPAAGKTGTTNDYHDAWFIGFTPRIVAGVWVGFDQPQTIMNNGYAAELAVPMWAAFMKVATRADKPEWFRAPRDIVGADVCRISGKRPSNGCHQVEHVSRTGVFSVRSAVYTEYFVAGTEPSEACPVHQSGSWIDQIAGGSPSHVDTGPVVSGERPTPVGTTATAPPSASPPAAEVSAVPAEAEVAAQPGSKKPGFWSRIFGRRDREDKDASKKPRDQPPPPRPPRF